MRTTIELPPALFRQAKARAAERGETLKALVTRALAAELGDAERHVSARARVTLPLFGDPGGPTVRVSAEDLERALTRDEVARLGRRSRRSRR